MKSRVLVGLAAWIALLGSTPAGAIEATAQGTFVEDQGEYAGSWEAKFRVVHGTQLSGTATLSGVSEVTTVDIEGTYERGELRLRVLHEAAAGAEFTAAVDRATLRGTFAVAGHSGTWEGAWDFAPGLPAEEVKVETVEPAPRPALEPAPGFDPDDPRSACLVLENERLMGLMSPAREQSLRRYCDAVAQLAPLPPDPCTMLEEMLAEPTPPEP